MTKYYLKKNLVFSSLTDKVKVIDKIDEIEIPSTTKSHLINNKIIITDIEKLIKKIGRDFEISKPIKDFENIKNKIIENKKELKKVTSNDYEFIEKTSGIEIIKSILTTVENSNINNLKEKIENYIEKTQKQELQKTTEIQEMIDIEKSKIAEINEKKNNIIENNSIKELEKLETEKAKSQKEIEKLEVEIINYKNFTNDKISKILERQENISNEIQDLKHLIKIAKTEIKTLKADLKLGKNKHFTNLTTILMIFTLGLIYWTKYTDTKYFILKHQKNITKYENKISKLEHEKFSLEKETRDENRKSDKKVQENSKKEETTRKKIDNLNIKIDKINKEIKEIEHSLKKEDTKIKQYEKDISKIETKVLDLETTKNEFEKYSTSKIQENLNKLINLREENINDLKKIREAIKSQKISIEGEYIIELE